MVLQSPEGLSVAKAVKFAFVASNNEAEYEAVLLGLQLAKELSVTNLELRCDSQLVACDALSPNIRASYVKR